MMYNYDDTVTSEKLKPGLIEGYSRNITNGHITVCCYILFPIIYAPMCMVSLYMLAILYCHTID